MADMVLEDDVFEKLQPYLLNKDLVICEDDCSFNNRWFHTPTNDRIDYGLNVLVRTQMFFDGLSLFEFLRRIKISQITVVQLKEFEKCNTLEHLEIDILFDDPSKVSTAKSSDADDENLSDVIQLFNLKRLYLGDFDAELKGRVKINGSSLEAVFFGKKHRLRLHSV